MIRSVWLHLKNILTKNSMRLFFSLTLLVCGMFLMSMLFLVQKNAQVIGETWKNKIEVIAYFSRDLSPDERIVLESELKARGDVDSYVFKTAADNQAEFQNLFPDLGKSEEDQAVINDVLSSTFEVKLKDPEKSEEVSKFLSSKDFVSNASFGKGITQEILKLVDMVRGLSIGTIALFSLFGFALLQLAIFMSVFSKKYEIEIFNLLGTPPVMIKLPFAIEGMFLCTVAAFIGLGISHLAFHASVAWLRTQNIGASIAAQFQSFSPTEVFVFALVAGLLGFILGHKSTQFLLKESKV